MNAKNHLQKWRDIFIVRQRGIDHQSINRFEISVPGRQDYILLAGAPSHLWRCPVLIVLQASRLFCKNIFAMEFPTRDFHRCE
jgi:hypothetical protein